MTTKLETVASALVTAWQAHERCKGQDHMAQWEERWQARVKQLCGLAPSGGGFDAGTRVVSIDSQSIRLETSFHHMNDGGMYDGWTEHPITVRPSFTGGLDITIRGRDRNNIKDHIHDVVSEWLESEAPPVPWGSAAAASEVDIIRATFPDR